MAKNWLVGIDTSEDGRQIHRNITLDPDRPSRLPVRLTNDVREQIISSLSRLQRGRKRPQYLTVWFRGHHSHIGCQGPGIQCGQSRKKPQ